MPSRREFVQRSAVVGGALAGLGSVQACASLRYKGGFRPHELLRERPALDAPPLWEPAPPDEP